MMNYEKENVMDPEESQLDQETSVVSLVDEENPGNGKEFNEKPHSLLGECEMRRERRKMKYKKEEHYLKKVWLSRTNSSCKSRQSSLNLSMDSLSVTRKKVFKSPFKKPNLKKNINFKFSSLRNSAKSDVSSQNSYTGSFSSMIPKKINKDMSTNEIIKIKKESTVDGNQMPGLRKRVCRKVYSILNKEFKKPKTLSKKLTLALEYRINLFFNYKKSSYIKTVKTLFKKLRVRIFFFFKFFLLKKILS